VTVGTKSILFGVHQFAIHPLFVALAWWRLYGFPFDPRLWVAFVVHDLGYWGKPNMDGPEGERHVEWGASLMNALFDPAPDRTCAVCWGRVWYPSEGGGYVATCGRCYARAFHWRDFCLYHSRFYAKRDHRPVSRLCVADKLATVMTPWWLYLPLARATGEIVEYMAKSEQREGTKYAPMRLDLSSDRRWFASMCAYMRRWVDEHKDGRLDTWTPEQPTLVGGARGGKTDRFRRPE